MKEINQITLGLYLSIKTISSAIRFLLQCNKLLQKVHSIMSNSAESRFSTLLVFTDFSDAAANAANYAAAFAMQVHSKRLLICYSEYIPFKKQVHIQDILLKEQLHQRNIARLNGITNELGSRINGSITIEAYIDERPLDLILRNFNKDQSVGLIVMGLAGKSASDQSLLGSNTVRITQITKTPVLIIPESASFKTVKKVIFACNLKNISRNTPVFPIKHLINKLGASVSILSVSLHDDHVDPTTTEEPPYFRQFWGKQQPKYHYTNNKDVVMEIMNFATTNKVQLVIAVPKKYGFFEKLFHNSVTKKLTHHIHLPLLLFKEENF